MKVLAIRGKNLASLANDFAVEFRQEPLASAGLFAITGPTGSGKSTLLDALCLALYGNTPRLTRASRSNLPDVGAESISATDTRGILRRGAGEGHAEVDFMGTDGIEYRARWSVRRARGRGDGRLQGYEMSLIRIADTQRIDDGTLSSVKTLIEGKIGLGFEQFTRAVLLAQNEFSTFLKADDNERAELLEMLTGTDRFAEISRRAFLRSKAENDVLQQLHTRRSDQIPLSDEVRAELDASYVATATAVEAIDKRRLELESHLRWLDTWEKAKRGQEEAQSALDTAIAQSTAASERRVAFEQVEAVQEARPLVDDYLRLDAELRDMVRLLLEERELESAATATTKGAATALTEAIKEFEEAEVEQAKLVPEIAQARGLQAQIDALQPGHATAKIAVDNAATALAKADAEVRTKESERVLNDSAREKLQGWLQDHAGQQILAENWSRWDAIFGQAQATAVELAECKKEISRLAAAEAARKTTHDEALVQQKRLDDAAFVTAKLLTKAIDKCSAFDPEALATRRALLDSRREQLLAADTVWRDITSRQQRHDDLQTRQATLSVNSADNAAALARAESARPALERDLQRAERALGLAETASADSVEALRAALEPDVACPVCGSSDHPYADSDPGLRAALDALRLDVVECRRVVNTLVQEIATRKADAGNHQRVHSELDAELVQIGERLAAAMASWAALPVAHEAATLPMAERQDWIEAQLSAVTRQLAEVGTDEKAMRAAILARDTAQADVNTAVAAQTKGRAAVASSLQAWQQASQARLAREEVHASASARLEGQLNDLDEAFPSGGWRTKWEASLGDFHAECGRQAAEWATQRKCLDELTLRHGALVIEIDGLSATHATLASHLEVARGQFASVDAELSEKQSALALLLGGRRPAEVEEDLAARILAARNLVTAKRSISDAARQHEASAKTALQVAKSRHDKTASDLASAANGVDGWIAAANAACQSNLPLNRDALQALLQHNAEWIGVERQSLQRLDTAISAARAVCEDRQRSREAHEKSRPTADDAVALREQLANTTTELGAAKTTLSTIQIDRARDDERRTRSATILGEIAAQETNARTWGQINDLVGSATGQKFRNIAQQLTLDVLLGYANHHLASLAHRYRLERIPETLGLLIVDQDMGDEVRSVHSLSGGESFLVSLALALGLASLSSHRVRVESLFVDEGFGSLDADALRIAMEALDGLQAQGRKVGVISHVQEMTERIGTQIRIERLSGGRSRVLLAHS